MSRLRKINIKQGETFSVDGQYLEDDGITPKPLIGVTLKSQVRTESDTLVATLTVSTLDAAAGTYRITADNSTLTWPVGQLFWDIKTSSESIDRVSETIAIVVERSNTKI
ncbi:hypothetical protein [Methylobacter sp.]|uniref:hypothetical protein n=1 Tax=Methylobacter sp. TaxID=2051955 RepID=UPI002489CDBD|nr:hypothetical protein [Methylobacter sp.]MDI1279277.1 hypothetical protein [Methylobacter sp.]